MERKYMGKYDIVVVGAGDFSIFSGKRKGGGGCGGTRTKGQGPGAKDQGSSTPFVSIRDADIFPKGDNEAPVEE